MEQPSTPTLESEIHFNTPCYVCQLKYLRDRDILMRYCALMESEKGIATENAIREYMQWYHSWHMEMENNA